MSDSNYLKTKCWTAVCDTNSVLTLLKQWHHDSIVLKSDMWLQIITITLCKFSKLALSQSSDDCHNDVVFIYAVLELAAMI